MRPANALNLAALTPLDQRLGLALLFSALLHAAVLLGVSFKMPEWKKSKDFGSTLEVVLVNSRSAARPTQADALAQVNLDGGGNTDADRRAKSPLPVLKQDQAETEIARKTEQVQRLEEQARALLTQVKAQQHVETRSNPSQKTAKVAPDATELMQRSMEAIRLEAQISRDMDNYQKRPKRKFVGARTQEYRFAQYIEDWRIKVERVGNLNYPEAARQQKLYGSLLLTVSIRADGSIENIEINSPSDHKILDAAAVQIVRLAGRNGFAPLPEDIRKDTDILSITRTWTFTRADQLHSQ